MLFPTRSRLPKVVRFKYKPRFYDPELEEKKERKEQRKKKFTGDDDGGEATKLRISGSLKRQNSRRFSARTSRSFRSNLILIAALTILIIFSWIFLEKTLPGIIESLF